MILFNPSIGKYFWSNGDRYEGDFKDGYLTGQGEKSDSLILTLFNASIGKYFYNTGSRYE